MTIHPVRRQFFRPLGAVLFRLVVVCCCAAAISSQAGSLVSTESPIAFFINVASRLLKSELDVDLNNIQIYPTNQYTPSVHRLLQVTANLYEAITNSAGVDYPYYPSVFMPNFNLPSPWVDSGRRAQPERHTLRAVVRRVLAEQAPLAQPGAAKSVKVCGIFYRNFLSHCTWRM
jgi:hypothetical protein